MGEETVGKPKERPQNKNLKRDAGPGRPKGQKNFKTYFEEAVINIAKAKNIDPEDFKVQMVQQAITKGFNGDRGFYADTMDRVFGKPQQNIDHTSAGEQLFNPQSDEKAKQAIGSYLAGHTEQGGEDRD